MLNNWGKSISTILYERLTSPWWGTLVIAWSIVNWRIIYLTVFVSSNEIEGNKIDYIISNYTNPWYIYGWPLIITVVLIGGGPFLEYYLYWLHLWFKERKYNKQIEVEKKQVLTIEKSAQLRQKMADLTSKHNRIVDDKDNELKIKDIQIAELQKQISKLEQPPDNTPEKQLVSPITTGPSLGQTFSDVYTNHKFNEQLNTFIKKSELWPHFKRVLQNIKTKNQFPADLETDVKEYFISNDLVDDHIATAAGTRMKLTHLGDYVYKYILNQQFEIPEDDSHFNRQENKD